MEIILISTGAMGIIISAILLTAHIIFTRYPKLTAKTGAFLVEAEQKDNVKIRGRRKGIWVKNLTKCKYQYKVNNKYYKINHTHYFTTKNQAPKIIPIVYIISFPRFSYINDQSFSAESYIIWGSVMAFISISLVIMGIVGLV